MNKCTVLINNKHRTINVPFTIGNELTDEIYINDSVLKDNKYHVVKKNNYLVCFDSSGKKIDLKEINKKHKVYIEGLFSVKDNGIGMSKNEQKGLFRKFYQADTSVTRKHGGTGLGLNICKGLVEGLGGKIWIESEKGTGTTVYFTIPLEFQIKKT